MAHDDHTSRCSNSSGAGGGSGGHRSFKKLKHKKVPQRGLGVAQLEKIINEEDQNQNQNQKEDSTVLTHNSIISPTNSSRVPPIWSSPIPPPPPLPQINPISASKQSNLIGGGGGGSGGGNWSRLWNGGGDYKFEGEKQNQIQSYGLDHPRYTAPFQANLGGLPYESNPPIWPPPPPNLMLQRSHHFQQPCSSSMVNVSANTSLSCSSSVMSFQMEPPSNQSYCGNNYPPLWPEEEKMIGMKRPYPFSLENVPIPSFHCKFPSAYVSPISRADEYASCSMESAYPAFRENPSSSGAISDAITKKFIDENQILTRDFLKLAPPQTSQSSSSSKESLHLSPCTGEQPQFERLTLQKDQSKDPTHLSGRGGSNAQPFLSLFPAAKTPMGQAGNSNVEAGESVDLNLKL